MLCSAILRSIPFRPASPPPLSPAGRAGHQSVPQCPVLCCPFSSVPACTLLPTDCPWPCRSILLYFISACPIRQTTPDHTKPTRPTLPAASLYRTVMFCAARSTPFRLAPSYRPTAHGRAILFCYASFRHARPQSTRPTQPAASRCCNALFIQTPFNSVTACSRND